MRKKVINILIPCYNEEENVNYIVNEIEKHVGMLDYDFEFTFIDDGSTDDTYDKIVELSKKRSDINVIKLTRNFGKESALSAGLDSCDSDAAIVIDADLQHPPSLIPTLICEWENGADIVDAVKISREEGENVVKRIFSIIFYRTIGALTDTDFIGSSDYKLLDRRVIEILNDLDERNRFFRGLTNWIGLQHRRVEIRVERRERGKSKWSWFRLMQLSLDAITSFTSKPLHVVTFLGLFTLAFSVLLGLQTLYNKIYGNAVSGFTTVILVLLILSSVIMISMGILGLYLSKVFDEVKKRPIYIIQESRKSRKGQLIH